MRNKVKDKRYDLTNSNEPETEDEAWTTDFEADDLSLQDLELYQRYKLLQHEEQVEQKYLDEQWEQFDRSQRAFVKGDMNNFGSLRSFWEIKEELLDKKFASKIFSAEIENHLAKLKFNIEIQKLDPVRIMVNDDGTQDAEFGVQTGFEPFGRIPEETKSDPRMPLELRKLLNKVEPEA